MKFAATGLFLLAISVHATLAAEQDAPAGMLDAIAARPLGPANMGGRIVDLAVVENRPATIYVASASGGIWKTVNKGASWKPIFDQQNVASMGAIAVAPSNPDIVWVGTGEANARNSVSWGNGVYRSTNAGKTWKHMGLPESHHIGRIAIHPAKPETVYVAALGHLWGPNPERGLYKTDDAGKTWKHVLALNPDTGCIDVVIDPKDPDTVYAAAYQVRRDRFSGGNPATECGPAAGLYKSTNAGKTWTKLAGGLPKRPIGRCGLAIARQDPRILYAVVQTDKTIAKVPGQPARASTEADSGGIFRSPDRGATWTKVNDLCPRAFYFGQVRIDPKDSQRIYVLGLPIFFSKDGGKNFTASSKGIHLDQHALWIDPANSDHQILGNDGGLYFTTDRGVNWQHVRNLPIAQFYGIALDQQKPFRIFGGTQDCGTWGGLSASYSRDGVTLAHWKQILGGDGFQCQVDPNRAEVVYAEGQWGNLYRLHLRTGAKAKIQPQSKKKGDYRFNWNSPLALSPHKPNVLYFGANFLFRSDSGGDKWEVISPDLTRGKPGPSPDFGHTLTTIAVSPMQANLLYTGSDDGRIHIRQKDTWTELSANVPGVPADRCISCLECSHFAPGTAYLAIDRHRDDDRAPYLFKTIDFGKTWQPLARTLPAGGPVLVVREDSRNPDLLFCGTEYGLYASLDGGTTWQRMHNGLPTVAVHDLRIHPRDRELVVATHGRGLYVMDIAPLEELTPKLLAGLGHLFAVKPAQAFRYRPGGAPGSYPFAAPNPPFGAVIHYYLPKAQAGPVQLTVTDAAGKPVAQLKGTREAGLHRVIWDLQLPGTGTRPLAKAGDYTAQLKIGGQELARKFKVEGGPGTATVE